MLERCVARAARFCGQWRTNCDPRGKYPRHECGEGRRRKHRRACFSQTTRALDVGDSLLSHRSKRSSTEHVLYVRLPIAKLVLASLALLSILAIWQGSEVLCSRSILCAVSVTGEKSSDDC